MSGLYHFHPQQTWGCVMCGKCCGNDWPVPADPEERKRISALEIPEMELPPEKWFKNGYIAKKKGKCIFSTCDGKRCRIHEKHGLEVKALACRLYPLDIHTWEDGSISASLRYDCPAVANGKENTISKAIVKIDQMADEIARYRKDPAPAYSAKIHPSIDRLREIARAYIRLFDYPGQEIRVCFLGASELLTALGKEEYSSDVTEAEEFEEDAVSLMKRNLENLEYMLETAEQASHNTLVGFRYQLLSFLRNDNGLGFSSRLRRMKQHLDFMLGGADLEVAEKKISPLMQTVPAEKDAFQPYMRWLKGRLGSLHFCGGTAFGITFEEGMRYLLLSLPAVTVIASAFSDEEKITRKDVVSALIQLDYSFLRTKLYKGKLLRKCAAMLTDQEHYATLLKSCGPTAEQK